MLNLTVLGLHVHNSLKLRHINSPSLYVREVTTPEAAEFQLLARDGKYVIARPADNRPLVAEIQGYTNETALQAIQRLEHIARWTNTRDLGNHMLPPMLRADRLGIQSLGEQDLRFAAVH